MGAQSSWSRSVGRAHSADHTVRTRGRTVSPVLKRFVAAATHYYRNDRFRGIVLEYPFPATYCIHVTIIIIIYYPLYPICPLLLGMAAVPVKRRLSLFFLHDFRLSHCHMGKSLQTFTRVKTVNIISVSVNFRFRTVARETVHAWCRDTFIVRQ